MSLTRTKDGHSVLLRYGSGKRGRFRVPFHDPSRAEARAAKLRDLAAKLVTSKVSTAAAQIVLRGAAEAPNDDILREVLRVAREELQRDELSDVAKKWWSTSAYRRVYERDGSTCRYCGAGDSLSIDHVIPRSRGGKDDPGNLVVACWPCNSRKGARTPEEAGMVLRPSRPEGQAR